MSRMKTGGPAFKAVDPAMEPTKVEVSDGKWMIAGTVTFQVARILNRTEEAYNHVYGASGENVAAKIDVPFDKAASPQEAKKLAAQQLKEMLTVLLAEAENLLSEGPAE